VLLQILSPRHRGPAIKAGVNLTLRTSALAALVLAFAGAAPASEPARDLGQGLSYYRVHEMPRDLPSPASGRPGACVLDLRFATADEATAATLKAWVRFNVSARTPVFVLENSGTAPALLAAFPGGGPQGLVVLAPSADKLSPDIAVDVAPKADKSAYAALEKGAALESLLSDFPDKPRIDEAYLEKEHISDADAPDTPADKDLAPRPQVDFLLQRAVQLHRGLLALKRI